MDQKPEDSSNPTPQTGESTQPLPEHSPQAAVSGPSPDSLNMGMLCHLLALTGIFTAGVGAIVGPLVIWLMKKETDPYVDAQGKESLNFQISVAIYAFVASVLLLVFIGFILLPIIVIAWLVLTIIGTIKASKGEPWTYPLTIRLIK